MSENYNHAEGYMPQNLDGSLYVKLEDAEQIALYDELASKGHVLGISTTNFKNRTPFLISRGQKVIGFAAIREFLTPYENTDG